LERFRFGFALEFTIACAFAVHLFGFLGIQQLVSTLGWGRYRLIFVLRF
jgi:hypothetical protein